ncbi:hypothetical protein [Myxosarcina sp. GI1]|uniref:NACHT C-terminal helical domain 2-containing protein n=1 Tax=Myxosarcina sp. GI1 TaxID=1541065 RepID=UPI0005646344|nr:hypothetical protein [Myxosarcina sp. GI1]
MRVLKKINCFLDYTNWSNEYQIYDVNYEELIDLLEKLQKQIPDRKEGTKVQRTFAQQSVNTWLDAFHFKPEMVDLSKQELETLNNYFYANLLMVECKKAAVKVSSKTWSEIESRMLMPFREAT